MHRMPPTPVASGRSGAPRQRQLDLRITELGNKSRWLDVLDTVLRDARILGEASWDLRRMRYELDLERIGYEAHTVLVTHERIYEYPSIVCRLSIAPVTSCIDGRSTSPEAWEGQVLEAIQLRDHSELALVSNYGTTRLHLGSAAALEIRDLGPPTEQRVICDYGDPAVDLQRAGQLLRARLL